MTFKKIGIVTDSAADLPTSLVEQWNISVIPCYVNYGGQSYADDGIDLIRSEFYQQLPTINPFPTTAAPSPGVAEQILREALAAVDHLIAVHVPETLSGTLNAVRLGAKAIDSERITIVDSQMLSFAQGLQAIKAAEVAQETGNIEAVLNALQDMRSQQRLFAVIASLEHLKQSGRVNTLVASFGSLLQIKPLIAVEKSEVQSVARVRTFKKSIRKLQDILTELSPLEYIAVLHIQNMEMAQQFQRDVQHLVPEQSEIPIVEVGPTIGTHLGPGSIGFTAIQKTGRK